VVQDTFLRAYKQLRQFDGRAAFATWLHRICVNCSLDFLRAKKSRRERSDSCEKSPERHWLDAVATPGPGPDRLAQSSQIAGLLRPALGQLSEMERAAFILRHYEGCDIAEIARTLGVQQNAAKHSVFRAVQKLRRSLEPAWGGVR
jgi:RNA polymerase sigma-70 factor (ECF subfamily)